MDDFGDHLSTNHLDDLQQLLQKLALSCASGLTTNIECAADNCDDMKLELTSIGRQVNTAILAPVHSKISKLENSIILINNTEKASFTIFNAVSIAAKISGPIGSLFKPLQHRIHPIRKSCQELMMM